MSLRRLLARPEGPFAPLAGWILSFANRRVNRWTVDLLALRPDDAVVEVGFGPGIGLRCVAEVVTEGRIAGIDPSEAMLTQALRRNREVAEQDRLDLRIGTAGDLPWEKGRFSRAFSVNSIHEWEDPGAGLAELSRVLAPGGQVALTTQARWLGGRPGAVEELARLYRRNLEEAGFGDVKLEELPTRRAPAICLLGWKMEVVSFSGPE